MRETTSVMIGGALVLASASAAAQEIEVEIDEDEPTTVIGVAVTAGGGVTDFVEEGVRDTTGVGGMWDVRVVIGTRTFLAFEAAYTGSASMLESRLPLDEDATLIGTGLEGAVRVNALPGEPLTPYAFAGIGWKRYDVSGDAFQMADTGIDDRDDLVEVPLGVGGAYRYESFVADARFTYRLTFEEDLVAERPLDEADEAALALDTWAVSARVGYEF